MRLSRIIAILNNEYSFRMRFFIMTTIVYWIMYTSSSTNSPVGTNTKVVIIKVATVFAVVVVERTGRSARMFEEDEKGSRA